MRPIWLIERSAYDDQNPQKMAQAARDRGMEVVEVHYVPLGGGLRDFTERKIEAKLPKDDACVFFYGSINAARYLEKAKKWYPGAWANFDELRCQKYYPILGPYLVQREYAFMPVGEIYRRKEWVFKTFGRNGEVFIRPDDNAKSFAGEKTCEEKWEDWYKLALFYNNDPSILSIVCRPEKIAQEWRLIVAEGKVITGSQYRSGGMVNLEAGYPSGAAAWVEKILYETKYAPHPMFVVDVGLTEDGFRIVEVGAVNTCGLYECDVDKIVEVATPLLEAEWKSVMT